MNVSWLSTQVIECECLATNDPTTEVGVVHVIEDLPREPNGYTAQLLPHGRLVELGTILGCNVDMR